MINITSTNQSQPLRHMRDSTHFSQSQLSLSQYDKTEQNKKTQPLLLQHMTNSTYIR